MEIELFSHVNIFFCPINVDDCWAREGKRSIILCLAYSVLAMYVGYHLRSLLAASFFSKGH